jgi:hypothetical protein
LHQPIEFIKGEELDSQLSGALLAPNPNVHPGTKVLFELSPKIREVSTLGTATLCLGW